MSRQFINSAADQPPSLSAVRRIGSVAVCAALAGLGLVGLAGTASAAPCGTVKDTTVRNNLAKVGEAHYTINCSGGEVLVTGRVQDSKPDGHCVESKVVVGTDYWLFRACGDGNTTDIGVRASGDNAVVYTYRV